MIRRHRRSGKDLLQWSPSSCVLTGPWKKLMNASFSYKDPNVEKGPPNDLL